MPTANDEDGALAIPKHEALELLHFCTQKFTKCGSHIPRKEGQSE